MRYVLAVLSMGAVLTFAASAALAGDGLNGYPRVDEARTSIVETQTVQPMDSAAVAGPSLSQAGWSTFTGDFNR